MSDQHLREIERQVAAGSATGEHLRDALLRHDPDRLTLGDHGPDERPALLWRLQEILSDLSEDTHCAGWLIGNEEDMPRLVMLAVETGERQGWGIGWVDPDEPGVREAYKLARRVGSWVDMDGSPYMPECGVPS